MSAVREGVRQVMAWLHGWTGLLLGYVLFVMCLAGTLSVFKTEIGRWMRPENPAVVAPEQAIVHATDWLAKHSSQSTGWYLIAPNDRVNTVEGTYDSAGGPYAYRMFDSLSGAPVARETLGGDFFYRLHFELQLPYPWGRLLASIAAIVMLVALITGIIAHRRIFKDFFTFRPRKGQRSWLDGHNALGVLAIPFHLMITFSGILTLFTLSMPWPIAANYGKDLVAAYSELTPGNISRPAAGRPGPQAPIAPMLDEAARRFQGGSIGRVYVINPGDAASVVTIYANEKDQLSNIPGEVSFDGVTGKVLGSWIENRPAVQTYGVIYGMHMARFAPVLLRWLYFLGGAMLTLAISTGLVLWIAKRRERAPLSIGNRILERLNAGVLTGVPIGCVAFLWANRLLPLGTEGRADSEVSIALWSAGVAILIGAALPPKRAWPVLTSALALACLFAPWLGNGAGWLAEAVARGDGALIGGDMLLTASGIAFGLMAVWMWRAKPAAPARNRRRARVEATA